MQNDHAHFMFVGDFDTYKVPPDVLAQAKQLSGERIHDRRTKGGKYLLQWCRNREAEAINQTRTDR
jgi:hypothetical protein